MARGKLRNRQRTFLSARMKIVVATSFAFLISLLLIIYFNFFQVKDSRAFSSGDYRTAKSGDWSDAEIWEVFDGEGWSPAIKPPGEGVKTILVTNMQKLEITNEEIINNLIIDEGAELKVESNTLTIAKLADKGGMTCNGTLILGTAILEGNGDVLIGPGAELMIGSDAGIDKKGLTGNIQMTGKKEFSREARYVFNGTVKQHTGNGLPAILKQLVIDNPSGIELDQNIQVLEQLTLSKGVLNTGRNTLTLGTSTNNICKMHFGSGHFQGNIKIWYGNENYNQLHFPFSDNGNTNLIGFNVEPVKFQKGMIEMAYNEGVPDDSRKSPFAARQVVVAITQHGYFSAMLSNGADEAWFQLEKIENNNVDSLKVTWNITQKGSNSQTLKGNHAAPGNNQVKQKAISNVLYGPGSFKNQLVVRFHSELKTMVTMQMTDSKGKAVKMETIQVEPGYNQYLFETDGNLPRGAYLIQLSNPSEIHTFKVLCDSDSIKDNTNS